MPKRILEDVEVESLSVSSESNENPLETLLLNSFGYPNEKGWNPSSLKLRPLENRDHDFNTVQGAVYWVNIDSKTAKEQPWYDSLTCKPHKNSLAPGKPKSFPVSYTNPSKPDWIGLPRFLGLSLYGPAKKDIRSFGLEANLQLLTNRTLRDYQITAVKNCTESLHKWGGATLIADCGAGKTAMALAIASSLKRKTLVLCNRSFLMQQWKHDVEGKQWTWADDNSCLKDEEMPNSFRIKCASCRLKCIVKTSQEKSPICKCGFRHLLEWTSTIEPRQGWLQDAKVGWLQGADGIDTTDKDIVIASIESVSQCSYSAEMLKEFGLVIIDEMHHLGALTLSQVLPKLPSRYILGISATPDRVDGLEHVLYWLAGPTAFVYKRLPSITGLTGTVKVSQKLFRDGERKEIVYKSGQLGFASMVSLLAQDETRNNYILQIILNSKERKKILLVTSIVDHAKFLSSQLNCIAIHGGCSSALVAQAKAESTKLVVATYQFLEEGYDDPLIDTLVMALPRSRIQQVVGRCERTHEGKLVPEVIDIVDTFSIFEAMSWKRHAFYKSRGFKINRK
jgi:superfamily II DNA or RNA helicase